jgi:hypothetical protein
VNISSTSKRKLHHHVLYSSFTKLGVHDNDSRTELQGELICTCMGAVRVPEKAVMGLQSACNCNALHEFLQSEGVLTYWEQ